MPPRFRAWIAELTDGYYGLWASHIIEAAATFLLGLTLTFGPSGARSGAALEAARTVGEWLQMPKGWELQAWGVGFMAAGGAALGFALSRRSTLFSRSLSVAPCPLLWVLW